MDSEIKAAVVIAASNIVAAEMLQHSEHSQAGHELTSATVGNPADRLVALYKEIREKLVQ